MLFLKMGHFDDPATLSNQQPDYSRLPLERVGTWPCTMMPGTHYSRTYCSTVYSDMFCALRFLGLENFRVFRNVLRINLPQRSKQSCLEKIVTLKPI